MPSVDNRVVRMEFDNAEFERRLQTTLGSLKDLNKALQMEGAKKGLADTNVAASKLGTQVSYGMKGAKQSVVDLNAETKKFGVDAIPVVSRGIEGVSKGFIAMSGVAIGALATITSSAVSAGAGIAKSLSLNNVIAGFQEYETNMNSIQTILANTKSDGSTLQDVNAALDQLNTYSDKTIYNFSQMARNIGTFTAAGVDLKTSTQAIKGIANLAAVSGSNADQASTAMYQLSQALASGSVKLMDWNSVVNAGMGGEVFQKNLFEAGKAFKTLKGVDMSTTFEEWKKQGNSFRDSLKDGWINTEVLTTTLGGLSGELNYAALRAKGFSDEGAKGLVDMGKTGLDAAQDVKTFTQAIDTTKEAIGSGWSATFRIVLGDFEEAKKLWTDISKVIGVFVSRSADARNQMLNIWKFLGGRAVLIDTLWTAFGNLMAVVKSVAGAFRYVFPKTTGFQLFAMTKALNKFVHALTPTRITLLKLRYVFLGIFSVIKIVTTVIKEAVKFFFRLGRALTAGLGPGLLDILAKWGLLVNGFQEGITKGHAIETFFNGLFDVVSKLIPVIQKVAGAVGEFFQGLFGAAKGGAATGAEKALSVQETLLGRIGDRLESLKGLIPPLQKTLIVIGEIFKALGEAVRWFWDRLVSVFSSGNFNNILDIVNTGLFAGLILLVRKFVKQGLKIDFSGGLFDKMKKVFEQLTNTLKAMQLKIKADALFRIAEALAVLTASLVVLSLIDSAALTKALAATAVGMGQLVGVLSLLNKLNVGPKTALAFFIVAAGMILLSGAMALLAGAAKKLGQLNMGELAKGIGAVTAMLGVLTGAAKLMAISEADFIRAGTGLLIMAVSLLFLGRAVKAFAGLNMGEMAKGFVGVSVGLTALAGALHLMPDEKKLPGTKLITTAIGLRILADVIKTFAGMSWADIVKGMAGLGLMLTGLTVALRAMPTNMKEIGVGLLITSAAIFIIAEAMKRFAGISWTGIAKGLIAISGSMLILAVAANAMETAAPGGLAILAIAGSLLVLASVIKVLSTLGWDTVLTSMLKLVLALGILALAALAMEEALPALIGLGIALALIGAAFALFGAGAVGVAKAFEILNRAGQKGAEGFIKAIKAIVKVLPEVATALAEASLDFVKSFLEGFPMLISAFTKIASMLLDVVIKLVPKFQQVLSALIMAGMATIRTFAGEYIKTGLFILTSLLQGIADNIGKVTDAVVDIVLGFVNALANRMDDIVGAGLNLMLSFLRGIANNIGMIVNTVTSIITKFLTEVGNNIQKIIDSGANILVKFLKGISDNLSKIATAVTDVITRFITELGNNASRIVTAGADAIINFLNGVKDKGPRIVKAFAEAGYAVVSSLIDAITTTIPKLADKAVTAFIGFFNAMSDVIDKHAEELGASMENFAQALIGGFGKTLFGAMKEAIKHAIGHDPFGLIGKAVDKVFDTLGISSPSKVFIYLAKMTMVGFAKGINDNSDLPANAMTTALSKVSDTLGATEEFNPIITPVLDLTRVAADAKLINGYIPSATVGTFSTATASGIAASEFARTTSTAENAPGATIEKMFEQNIYAPDKLSMADIYKQTRNQIAMAKEELKIP
jgi:tape measure domain-containing protein